MKNIKNGGPAYPQSLAVGPDDVVFFPEHRGMTLRDYFAASVSPALVPMAADGRAIIKGNRDATLAEIVAHNAYAIADAMLKAREAQ